MIFSDATIFVVLNAMVVGGFLGWLYDKDRDTRIMKGLLWIGEIGFVAMSAIIVEHNQFVASLPFSEDIIAVPSSWPTFLNEAAVWYFSTYLGPAVHLIAFATVYYLALCLIKKRRSVTPYPERRA
ncbi:MAG: hypothetical protein R2682_02300 [Pyrinomonadaceae bacterium]